jgi:glycosyltransferase involved in cell wall biosynthesis
MIGMVPTMELLHECADAAVEAAPAVRVFDGVICFGGEDWWYHNRGHYDMQMMRELSARVPVLYVNSLGMRTPSAREGKMFFRRVARKLKSLRRGLVRVRDGFAVFSPIAPPGVSGGGLGHRWLAAQVRRAAHKLGITRPLVWVACPPAAEVVGMLGGVGLVYQRTDRFESFTGVDAARISRLDRELKAAADLTLFCSTLLYEQESGACAAAAVVDHGVDFDRFERAGLRGDDDPPDVASLPRPRVGFVGGIDAHTFDPELFQQVARRLPEATFVLVGACSLTPDWCGPPNVVLLGQRAYDQVPGYMAACDVLIMPWNSSPWIQACNPVKLKEYLAVGRPLVSTPFRELERYAGLVRVGRDPESFAREIRAALAEPGDAGARRERVRAQTWSEKSVAVLCRLGARGLVPSRVQVDAHRRTDRGSPER